MLSGFQWTLAPTRVNGTQPRPDLRPRISSNSWALPCNSSAIQGQSEKLLRSPPVALAVAVAAGVRQADVYAQSPSIHRAPDG